MRCVPLLALLLTRVSRVRPSRPPSASVSRRLSSARPFAAALSGLPAARASSACKGGGVAGRLAAWLPEAEAGAAGIRPAGRQALTVGQCSKWSQAGGPSQPKPAAGGDPASRPASRPACLRHLRLPLHLQQGQQLCHKLLHSHQPPGARLCGSRGAAVPPARRTRARRLLPAGAGAAGAAASKGGCRI